MNDFGIVMDTYLKEMEERITEKLTQQLENNPQKKPEKMWMNKTECAKYLGVSFKTLDKFIKEHTNFPSTNISGAIRFNAKRVDEWFEIHDEMIKMRSRKRAS